MPGSNPIALDARHIRESEQLLRLLLDSAPQGIYAIDTEGLCTLCNPASLTLLGYLDASELIGKSAHDLIHHAKINGQPYPAAECHVKV